jgi:hypothetical protein
LWTSVINLPFLVMTYWESLNNWSLAVNLDDLAASILFPLAEWKTAEVETFSSSQGSRIVNMEKSSFMHSFLARALNLPNLKSNKEVRPGSIEALCYAPLCCYRKHKAWYTELFSFRSPHGRLFRPLSAIVISVTTIRRHDVALPSISATVFTTT